MRWVSFSLRRVSIYKYGWIFLFPVLFFIASFLSAAYADDYLLGRDDVLKINVYREEELKCTVRISSDGYISFPFIGRVKAEGLSVSQFEEVLTDGLKEYLKNPQVTVFIQEYSTITVSGQVEEPGLFPLNGNLTVIEAISLAGGFTKIAAKNKVKIMRVENGEQKIITVRVADISKKGEKSKDEELKRGDIVFVPESMF